MVPLSGTGRVASLVVIGLAIGGGCGGGSNGSPTVPPAGHVEMFVAPVDEGGELVGFAVERSETGAATLRGYLCDGQPDGAVEWFVGPVANGEVDLTSTLHDSARLTASVGDEAIGGRVVVADGGERSFTAPRATHGDGLFHVTVGSDASYAGTSLAGGTLVAKQRPAAGNDGADPRACGGEGLDGYVVAPDETRRDFAITDLSACSEDELRGAGLPVGFAAAQPGGTPPGDYTAIVAWRDDAYSTIFGRAFVPSTTGLTIPSIGLGDLLKLKRFEVDPNVAIPDNDPNGVIVSIPVTSTFTFTGLAVSVDIEHSFAGDLTLDLLRNGTRIKTLRDGRGGSSRNIVETYQVTPSEVGTNKSAATWSLKVTDTAATDTGRVRSLVLTFQT